MGAEIPERGDSVVQGVSPAERTRRVTVIEDNGQAALVEWRDGRSKRAWVPSSLVRDGQVPEAALGTAPYGLDFAALPKSLDLRGLEQQLHDAQIWTQADMEERAAELQRIAKGYAAQIIRAIIACGRENA